MLSPRAGLKQLEFPSAGRPMSSRSWRSTECLIWKGSRGVFFFFCQLSVGLVPLILQMEGNRPKGITVALMAPVGLAVTSLGALS